MTAAKMTVTSAAASRTMDHLELCWRVFMSLDNGYKLFLGAFLTLVAAFHALIPLYPTTKQRAWILTTIGSATFTLFSLPLLANVVIHRGDVSHLVRIPWWSDSACRIFQAYLASDLAVGSVYYPQQINPATGWGHHIVYMILVDFLIRWEWSHIFTLTGLMELPTFLLSIATLYPVLRNDILFAATFLATRILFHIGLFVSYLPQSTRLAAVGGSFVPAILFAVAFPMHLMWFIGSIKGFIRRAKARQEAKVAPLLPAASEEEKRSVEVLVHPRDQDIGTDENSLVKGAPEMLMGTETTRVKLYPPSTHTLPSTPMRHSPPRLITLSPSVRSRSISRSRSSSLSASASSSPINHFSSTASSSQVSYDYPMYTYPGPSRPAIAPRRRSLTNSLISTEREESLRRMASAIAELAGEAIAVSPTMQSAVAVGKGVARTYSAYRGRASAGVRRRGLVPWRRGLDGAGNGDDDAINAGGRIPVRAY